MHAFYAGRQLEGEDICDFSHALSQLLNSALQQSHNAVSDPQLALRDQFIEVIRDMTLRRELHKLVREKPQSTLFDVREEAMMWVVEDRPRGANLMTHCQCAGSDVCEVRFQSISAEHEEVKIDQRDKPMSDSDPSNLLSRLHIGGTPEQQAKLGVLLMKHADVFAVPDEDLAYTDWVKHEIHLTDYAPITKPYRRIPPTQFEEVKEHISGILPKGVVQEISSSFASPIVLVPKVDGTLRLFVDQRC